MANLNIKSNNDINKVFNNIRKDIYNNSTNITEITTIDILINN